MLGQAPQNPAVVLVIAAVFVSTRSVQDPFLRGKVARQSDGALIVEPGLETFLRFLVVTAPVQVHDHHARFIAEGAVVEGTDARKPAMAAGLALAIDEQMAGVCAIKFV